MKNIIFIIAFTSLLFSCSNSDNSDTNSNNCQTLQPPGWIQGTWIKQNSPVGSYTGYKFTSDDVIDIFSQSSSNSRKFQLDFYCTSNVNYIFILPVTKNYEFWYFICYHKWSISYIWSNYCKFIF